MAPRKYEQTRRAEQTAQTRRRIVEAVHEQLRTGKAGTLTLDQVARDTGVARSTLYLIFGSRDGLMEAVAMDLAERTGVGAIVEAEADPDVRRTLRRGIRAGVEMYARDREVYRGLNALAHLQPGALGRIDPLFDRNRAVGMATLVRRLGEQGVLRPDVTRQEAEELLWVITGFDAFDLLWTGKGLDVDTVTDRLVTLAERSVCVPDDAPARPPAAG